MIENKYEFLDYLEKSLGNISMACKAFNISRATYYEWKKKDPEFAQRVKDLRAQLREFVINKLYILAVGSETKKIIKHYRYIDDKEDTKLLTGESEITIKNPPDFRALQTLLNINSRDEEDTTEVEFDFNQLLQENE